MQAAGRAVYRRYFERIDGQVDAVAADRCGSFVDGSIAAFGVTGRCAHSLKWFTEGAASLPCQPQR